MKILRFSSYFDPEITAATHLMNDLYEGFAHQKINCQIITPMPTRGISEDVRLEYKNKTKELIYDGFVEIDRFPMIRERHNPFLRAIRYFICSFYHYYYGIRAKDVDLIFSGSTPPTNGLLSVLVAIKLSKKYKRKVSFVYELQDIFPDSMVNAKLVQEGSLLWKVGRIIENYTYEHCDHIIVPTNEMKNNLIQKNVSSSKVTVISNWIDDESVKHVNKSDNCLFSKLNIADNKFIVVYAGNFGEAQGADIILDVAEQLISYKDIVFIIFGGGSCFREFKEKASSLNNVVVNDLLPIEFVPQIYSLGDIALITCKKGTGKAAMPSKVWSILACETPIIASYDLDSELERVLIDSGAGTCVEPEDSDALRNAIINAYESMHLMHPDNCLSGRAYVHSHASKQTCVMKYIDIIKYYGEKYESLTN